HRDPLATTPPARSLGSDLPPLCLQGRTRRLAPARWATGHIGRAAVGRGAGLGPAVACQSISQAMISWTLSLFAQVASPTPATIAGLPVIESKGAGATVPFIEYEAEN